MIEPDDDEGIEQVETDSWNNESLMTSFAARGLVDLVPALAVMLGANIATTLIVQAISFDISAVARPSSFWWACWHSTSAAAG